MNRWKDWYEQGKIDRERAFAVFPGLTEIRLFGSLAKGGHTGLSDVDILVVAESEQKDPLEMVRPNTVRHVYCSAGY
jgi:predicted nucleotidyltransferase